MSLKTLISSIILAAALGGGVIAMTALQPEEAQAQVKDAKIIVDEAKAQGLIGETVAGYLAVVDQTVSSDVINAMNEINIRRKSLYTRLAREQNVQIEVVAALTGEKVVASATPGQKVMMADGQWKTIR